MRAVFDRETTAVFAEEILIGNILSLAGLGCLIDGTIGKRINPVVVMVMMDEIMNDLSDNLFGGFVAKHG